MIRGDTITDPEVLNTGSMHLPTLVSSIPRAGRSTRLTSLSLAALVLAPLGCSRAPSEIDLGPGMTSTSAPSLRQMSLSTPERYGRKDPNAMADQAIPEDLFDYRIPDGWTAMEPTDLRVVNLKVDGHPEAECYVTMLGGDGGGMVANLNRWRRQMGLQDATEEELFKLPTTFLFGMTAPLLELEGSFVGMDGTPREDWGLLGTLFSSERFTVFVKMTAPLEVLQAERDGFLDFCTSLRPAGMEAPSESEAAPAPGPEIEQEEDGRFVANGFRFLLPPGWADAGPRTMRVLNFQVGEGTICYLTILGGDGGGLTPNLNRWQGQMGQDPLSEAEIDALPRADLAGQSGHLLEASGEFVGMEGEASSNQTLIGIALMRGNDSLFLKMVGPSEEVAFHRDAMIAFAATLEEVQ